MFKKWGIILLILSSFLACEETAQAPGQSPVENEAGNTTETESVADNNNEAKQPSSQGNQGSNQPSANPEPEIVPEPPVAKNYELLADSSQYFASGDYHTCAIPNSNPQEIYCWGDNTSFQSPGIGAGDFTRSATAIELPQALSQVKRIYSGVDHNCLIDKNGQVFCWGKNTSGELGLGINVSKLKLSQAVFLGRENNKVLKATDLALGISHTCALLENQKVKCWGSQGFGKLGIGNTGTRGLTAESMLDLPYVDLGGLVKAISAGNNHNCAILEDDSVKCWGKNTKGQLGYGHANHRGSDLLTMGENLPRVDLGTNEDGQDYTALKLSLGLDHSCALLNNYQVKCWGNNIGGVSGFAFLPGLRRDIVGDDPGEMGTNLAAVPLPEDIIAISSGDKFACAVSATKKVYCWGQGVDGQLGQGHNRHIDSVEEIGNLDPVSLPNERSVAALTVGEHHVCLVLETLPEAAVEEKEIRCWGDNFRYNLGLGAGDIEDRGDEPDELGEALGISLSL